METTSFSLSHCITNGSNHLQHHEQRQPCLCCGLFPPYIRVSFQKLHLSTLSCDWYLSLLLYSQWILRYLSLVRRHITDVLVVQPLDLEVQVHVLGTFTQSFLFVLCGKQTNCHIICSIRLFQGWLSFNPKFKHQKTGSRLEAPSVGWGGGQWGGGSLMDIIWCFGYFFGGGFSLS